MQRRYHTAGNQATTASSYKTALLLVSTSGIRPAIYEFNVGTEGAPAENAVVYVLQRSTTTVTLTAVTPLPLDPTDATVTAPAATAIGLNNASAEPTYTSNQFLWGPLGFNQRATYRWVAAPGGELLLPAIAAAGAGMQCKSAAYTGITDATFDHME